MPPQVQQEIQADLEAMAEQKAWAEFHEYKYYHGGRARFMDPDDTISREDWRDTIEGAVGCLKLRDVLEAYMHRGIEHGLPHAVVGYKVGAVWQANVTCEIGSV
jgi:hypothetical protein